jgi:hypothetical protein
MSNWFMTDWLFYGLLLPAAALLLNGLPGSALAIQPNHHC